MLNTMQLREPSGINTFSFLSGAVTCNPSIDRYWADRQTDRHHMAVPRSITPAEEQIDDVGDLDGLLALRIEWLFFFKCTTFNSITNPISSRTPVFISFLETLHMDRSVDTVTRLRARRSGVRFPVGARYIFLSKILQSLWRPTSLLYSGHWLFHHQGKVAG